LRSASFINVQGRRRAWSVGFTSKAEIATRFLVRKPALVPSHGHVLNQEVSPTLEYLKVMRPEVEVVLDVRAVLQILELVLLVARVVRLLKAMLVIQIIIVIQSIKLKYRFIISEVTLALLLVALFARIIEFIA